MIQLAKSITPADVRAALNSLDELDKRMTKAEINDPFQIYNPDYLRGPHYLRGDFGADTVNLLRSEFARLWRMAEANADVDVLYCAPDVQSETAHT